jgi:hypothetical protein
MADFYVYRKRLQHRGYIACCGSANTAACPNAVHTVTADALTDAVTDAPANDRAPYSSDKVPIIIPDSIPDTTYLFSDSIPDSIPDIPDCVPNSISDTPYTAPDAEEARSG